MQSNIEETSNMFFEKLALDYSHLTVTSEGENIFRISLKSEDSHLLIGPHGKNLEVVTHMLKLLLSKTCGIHLHIHLEVNDYLAKKDEKLLNFIQSKIEYVQSSGKEIVLPFFNAYERKKVHSYVGGKGGNISTESRGEGEDRRIHLCKQEEKMTIDLDGDNI